MKNMPATAGGYKRKFCLGDNSSCTRFIVSEKLGPIEEIKGLFPNQHDRVKQILDKYMFVK